MNHEEHQARIQYMVDLMNETSRQMRPDPAEQWPEVELTLPQMKTLMLLANGPLRMSDVAEQIGSSYSATTAMIDRLVEKDLVERAHGTTDRRVVTCRLNEKGVQTLDMFWRVQQDHMREVGNILTPDELEKVIVALEILSTVHMRLQQDNLPAA